LSPRLEYRDSNELRYISKTIHEETKCEDQVVSFTAYREKKDIKQKRLNIYELMNTHLFCNNCGKSTHLAYQCRIPITSNGVVAVRKVKYLFSEEYQYLMIRRKDSLGYLDFLRGKFSLFKKEYIINMMNQMTRCEKELLRNKYNIVKQQSNTNNAYHRKDKINLLINGVKHKHQFYDLKTLLDDSDMYGIWEEPEWGFPKGRRNENESDYECAIREFVEETGIPISSLKDITNILPIQEIFTGSNYFSYKHKYYVMFIDDFQKNIDINSFQKTEVSSVQWKNISNCIGSIRPYNLEKIQMIHNLDFCLNMTKIISYNSD
jgi:8-oxo-dGTP pyrophosphatase MutT (NUDIX family)